VIATNPTGGAAAWSLLSLDSPPGGSNQIGTVSFPTTTLCVAPASGSAGTPVYTSTNPTGGLAAWTPTTGVDSGAPLDGIWCASATLCVAQDVATDVVTTTDPTGGASAWTTFAVGTSNHLTGGVTCAGASLCVAVGMQGIVTSTNP
jgi:hypothetical protein